MTPQWFEGILLMSDATLFVLYCRSLTLLLSETVQIKKIDVAFKRKRKNRTVFRVCRIGSEKGGTFVEIIY